MNCDHFKEHLPEYLDEALPTSEQAEMLAHSRACAACAGALAQQKEIARSIRLSLDRETQNLFLRPEARRKILEAAKEDEQPQTLWDAARAFISAYRRQAVFAGLAALCLIIVGIQLHRDHAKSVALAQGKFERCEYTIQIPLQSEELLSTSRNGVAVDAVVTAVSVLDASYSEEVEASSQLESHRNKL